MTRSAAHKASLKALLESVGALRADYSELQTFHSMSLEATTEAAVSVLMSDYKEGSESILRTTALAIRVCCRQPKLIFGFGSSVFQCLF